MTLTESVDERHTRTRVKLRREKVSQPPHDINEAEGGQMRIGKAKGNNDTGVER